MNIPLLGFNVPENPPFFFANCLSPIPSISVSEPTPYIYITCLFIVKTNSVCSTIYCHDPEKPRGLIGKREIVEFELSFFCLVCLPIFGGLDVFTFSTIRFGFKYFSLFPLPFFPVRPQLRDILI